MGALTNWISHNLLYAEVIAVVLVIIGAFVALKSKQGGGGGWGVVAAGVAFGVWALHLKGLV